MIAGHPIVENCLAGYNSSIFAYGQTGAGKTFTMQGAISDDLKRGLAPRVFSYIFTRIAEEEDRAGRENLRFACRCSFLEIYNETITDLLNPASTNLAIREDIKRGCYVESLSEESVLNVDDAMALMKRGAENRRIGETKMNHESSRSHSVFTCVLESNTQEESGLNHVRFSRLNLVDLAGSERNKSSGATGEHFREACSINRSLTTLGRVIMELVEAQRDGKRAKHVPYRDSRLTFLLQDSLGGNAKTMIIANVSPTAACAHETLSTLQFASRAKYIRNKAVVNEDTRGDVAMLQREIYRLHRELDLVRNECTEPVVRENAELNAQLAEMQEEAERSRHKLDSIMGEARKNKKEASWAKQKVAELESANKALAQSYERLTEAIQDMADCNAASADVAQRLHADQLALEVSKRRELASQLSHEQAEHRQADRMCYELENVREQQQQELEAKDRRLVELAEQHAEQLEAKDSRTAKLQQQHAEQLQVKDEQMAERCQQHKLKVEAAERRAADLCQQHAKELQAKDSRVAELQQQRAEEVDALQQAQLDSMAAVLRERDSQLAALQESTSQQAAAQEVAIRSLEQKLARSEDACRTALEDNAQLVQEFENQSAKMARLRSDGDEARAGAEKQRLLLESDNQRIRQDLEDAQQRYKDAHDRCEALETDYRRVRREKLDFEQEAETRDRRQQSQIKDLDLEVSEMKLAARMLKEELDAEIVKATKYKRAFNDIDTLIMWARTPPNSARGHRANTPRYCSPWSV
ncbi:hypothetical protein WJX72_007405 [[Myrmecia] bisecta]|uniref:Kinesin-like protein n=1 Tax=[Myrmecia] bisecta TaxID=41462 RepID=A0AAW1PD17_9CHLO